MSEWQKDTCKVIYIGLDLYEKEVRQFCLVVKENGNYNMVFIATELNNKCT